jgi:hypothetical protein
LIARRTVSSLRHSRRRRRICPSLKWHQLQRAESFPASYPTSRYVVRAGTPHLTPAASHPPSRAPKRPPMRTSKLPRNSGVSSGDNAPVAARASTKSRQASSIQSDEGAGASPRVAAPVKSQVVGDSGVLPVSAKAKRRNTIAISRDDLRAKPLPNEQRSATGMDSPATIPPRVDDRPPQSRKRTVMARYVFGDELKPGERWKRRLLTMR